MRHFFKYTLIGSGCAVWLLIVITVGFKINAKVIRHEMLAVPATVETRVIIVADPGADISGAVNQALRDYRAPVSVEVVRSTSHDFGPQIDRRGLRLNLKEASERAAARADSECGTYHYFTKAACDTVAQKVNGKWRFNR